MNKKNFVVFAKTILSILFLGATLSLYSCNDGFDLNEVKKDVDDSEWHALYNDNIMRLSFDDGEYLLRYTYRGENNAIKGLYTQKGVSITFQEVEFFIDQNLFLKSGSISQIGSSMSVPIYDAATGKVVQTMEFSVEFDD